MSAYTPTNLYNFSPFEASVVSGNFEKLSDVLNSEVGDYALVTGQNIKNDRASLDFTSFRRNTLVESFRSAPMRSGSASGEEAFLVIADGQDDDDRPFGVYRNSYDVAGSGLRFYLRDSADVKFESQVSLSRIKSGSLFAQVAGYGRWVALVLEITATLVIDGVVQKTIERDLYITDGSGTPGYAYADYRDIRGLSICFDHIEQSMEAGAHTAHINLAFVLGSTPSPSVDYSGMQIKGRGGSTCATAFYK
jgi:hypothetical protein